MIILDIVTVDTWAKRLHEQDMGAFVHACTSFVLSVTEAGA